MPTFEGMPIEDALAAVRRFRPHSADRRYEQLSRLDRHYAWRWLQYLGGVLARPQLDTRRRMLVLVGQYTMVSEQERLGETIDAALAEGVDPRHVLEVILQSAIYAGDAKMFAALDTFEQRATSAGVDLSGGGLDLDASVAGRDFDEEKQTWLESDIADPRFEKFLAKYPWTAMSSGLRLRPGHHLNILTTFDGLDEDFLQVWLSYIYEGLYPRQVLTDADRYLCMVGNTLAVGESYQMRRHLGGALRVGVEPKALLEVIFQTGVHFGHPNLVPQAVDDLIGVLEGLGRTGEIVRADALEEVRAISLARIAKRGALVDVQGRVSGT